jgi:hypothetical protein
LVRGTDPRIRIRTKMSLIHNIAPTPLLPSNDTPSYSTNFDSIRLVHQICPIIYRSYFMTTSTLVFFHFLNGGVPYSEAPTFGMILFTTGTNVPVYQSWKFLSKSQDIEHLYLRNKNGNHLYLENWNGKERKKKSSG